MAAKRFGATLFNRVHGLHLLGGQLVAKLRPIRRPIAAKDVTNRHHGMPAVSCSKASVACCSTLCVRWVESAVVVGERCPSQTWITRTFAPASRRWVA